MLALAAGLGLGPVQAQEAASANAAPAGASTNSEPFLSALALSPRAGNGPRLNASVDYSYVGEGRTEFQGGERGDSAVQSLNVSATMVIPAGEKWFVPVGLGQGNSWLDAESGLPVPEEIHTLRLSAGLGYHVNDRLDVSVSIGPNFYRLSDVDNSAVGVFGLLSATYRLRPGLTLTAGLAVNPDSEVPVLPAVGARWAVSTNVTVSLMFPRPVVIYRLNPKVNLFAGGDFRFQTFRTEQDMDARQGVMGFNNAIGTHRDFRVGAGAEYELVRGLWASVEVGYSFGREIEYTRLEQTVEFGSAPYAQVGLKYRF